MFQLSWYFLFMLIGEAICFGIQPYDLKIVSFSSGEKNGVFDISKVRLIGRERLVNGTVTIKVEMDNENYSFSVETFSDPVGDGNYKLLPFYIPLIPICEGYKKYRPLFSNHAQYGRQTDFPVNRDICPIPKGTFYLKNVQLSAENWPMITPRGFLRANGSFYRINELVGTYSVTALITDKY